MGKTVTGNDLSYSGDKRAILATAYLYEGAKHVFIDGTARFATIGCLPDNDPSRSNGHQNGHHAAHPVTSDRSRQ